MQKRENRSKGKGLESKKYAATQERQVMKRGRGPLEKGVRREMARP